jgi:predicted AAA+ superfamily ATPase
MNTQRVAYLQTIRGRLRDNPIVSLVGPRQAGKTTLARMLAADTSGPVHLFDLEAPSDLARLANPELVLRPLTGLVILDEVQRRPDLFPLLRVLADRLDLPARFLILGSASPALLKAGSESLAGRVSFIDVTGFALSELGADAQARLWWRGGFPRAYLAADDTTARQWLEDFRRTFLERDLASLGFGMSPAAMGRVWTMLAHYHGQVWNGTEIASSMGIAPNTARSYLDALDQTLMVRRLLPWHANVGKRLVKTPKIYFRDAGVFHALSGIRGPGDILTHPKRGASWEGFALEEVLRANQPEKAYFYAVHSTCELDLLMLQRGKKVGVEFKRADAPAITRAMQTAIADLDLDELWIVYPGRRGYQLDAKVSVRPLIDCVFPGK